MTGLSDDKKGDLRENILLSILIITRDRKHLLTKLLDSITANIQGLKYEVIIVDNASTDSTKDLLDKDSRPFTKITNSKNEGVAKARNQALSVATGKYILIIDDDAAIVSENFLQLISYMDDHLDVGLLGCMVYGDDGKLFTTVRTFPLPIHVFLRRLADIKFFKKYAEATKTIKKHHLAGVKLDSPTEVNFIEAVFHLIRGSAIKKIGPLDGKMFYGFEDSDYCVRIQKAGSKNVYYPGFKIFHSKGDLTRKKKLQMLTLQQMMSYVRFYFKHAGWIYKKNKEIYKLYKNTNLLP